LSEAEFWSLTPAQANAFFGRLEELVKEADYRAGQIAAVMASGLSGKAFKPSDFFPRLRDAASADQGDSPEALQARMGLLRMAMQAQAANDKEG
jgi:hypothetical protein